MLLSDTGFVAGAKSSGDSVVRFTRLCLTVHTALWDQRPWRRHAQQAPSVIYLFIYLLIIR